MKKIFSKVIIALLLCINLHIVQTNANNIDNIVSNHIFNTYSSDEIDDNLYKIYSYEKNDLTYTDYYDNSTKFNIVSNGVSAGFGVGGNTIITSFNTPRKIGFNGFYIICKQKINNYDITEKCLGNAELKFYDEDLGIVAFEIDGIDGKKIENRENLDFYKENGFSVYGVYNNSTVVGNNFKNDIEVYHYENENKLLSDDLYNSFGLPIFYNNSFFGIIQDNKIITKDTILDFLQKKGQIKYYNANKNELDEFKLEVKTHIEKLESWSTKIPRDYLEYGLEKDSLYSKIYEISNFDELEKNIDGVYIKYIIEQDEKSNEIDSYEDSGYYSDEYNTNILKDEFLKGEDFDGEKVENNKIVLNIADLIKKSENKLINGYEGFNNKVKFRLYVKIGDSYYADGDTTYLSYDLTKKGKIDAAINLTYDENYFISSGLFKRLKKIQKKLDEKSFYELIKKLENKTSSIEKNAYIKIGNIVDKIHSEEDFEKNKMIISKETEKYNILENLLEFDVNGLLDYFLESLDSYENTNDSDSESLNENNNDSDSESLNENNNDSITETINENIEKKKIYIK